MSAVADIALDAIIGQAVAVKQNGRNPNWRPEEDDFVRAHLGSMSLAAIGAELGRSPNAIKIRIVRKGMPSARRQPGWITAYQVGVMLGLESHIVGGWIDLGILPGEYLPFEKVIQRRVSWEALKRWLIKPEHWPYFKVKLIHNAHLRRLVTLAQERWGDEWWSMRQAADYHHTSTNMIRQQIRKKKVPAIQCRFRSGRNNGRWANWYIRRSDVEKMKILRAGENRLEGRTARGDAFILAARARGLEYQEIARMMKWPMKRVMYVADLLKKQSETCPKQARKVSLQGLQGEQ